MLETCLNWWCRQMRDWLPTRRADGPALMLTTGHPFKIIAVTVRRRRQVCRLGEFGFDADGMDRLRAALPPRCRPRAVHLCLPAQLLLEREVVLPAAAERSLEFVLTHEMDRLTPFRSAEVFWAASIESRDPGRGRLRLRLCLVQAAALQAPLALLQQAGFAVSVLELARPDGSLCLIALARAAARRQPALIWGAVAAGAACAMAAVVLPFVQQGMARQRTEAAIAALQPIVAEAQLLRARLAAAAALHTLIGAEQARLGDTLGVLAAMTAVTPDDTFLTDLSLQSGRLQIDGISASAVQLIGDLARAPMIRNPQFTAPVTRAQTRAAESFAIKAEIGAQGADYAGR